MVGVKSDQQSPISGQSPERERRVGFPVAHAPALTEGRLDQRPERQRRGSPPVAHAPALTEDCLDQSLER